MNFFIKLWLLFLQVHDTILQRVKQFLNVKMKNLEKIKQEKSPGPAPYFHPLFKIFQIPPLATEMLGKKFKVSKFWEANNYNTLIAQYLKKQKQSGN